MRISDWSSDVCSSDLADVGDRRGLILEADAVLAAPAWAFVRTALHVDVARRAGLAELADRDRHIRQHAVQPRENLPDGVGHAADRQVRGKRGQRSEEHTSELQSLMRISYAVFCL